MTTRFFWHPDWAIRRFLMANGPCLPGAPGMRDLRLRLPSLISSLPGSWSNGLEYLRRPVHARTPPKPLHSPTRPPPTAAHPRPTHGSSPTSVPTLFKEFIEGEADRIVVARENAWRVGGAGEGAG
jgi:hypothetical protein